MTACASSGSVTSSPPEAPAPGPAPSTAATEARELIARLIRLDTTNPPGREAPAAEALAEYLSRAGIATELIRSTPGRASLLARLEAGEPGSRPLLLLSHLDTAPADPEGWPKERPPLGGVVADGALWGRGALGGKALAAAQAVTLARVKREGLAIERPILLVAAADGEGSGAAGIAKLLEERSEILNSEVALTEGGLALRDLLPGKRPLFAVATSEKGFAEIEIVATGQGGSAAEPEAVSASARLTRALERIDATRPRARLVPAVERQLDAIGGALGFPERLRWSSSPLLRSFTIEHLLTRAITRGLVTDSIAVTRLSAGGTSPVVPDRARALLRCQLLPDASPGQLRAQIRAAVADPDVFVTIRAAEQAATSSRSAEVLDRIFGSIRDGDPEAVIVESMSTETTDARHLRRHGVPAYGFAPFLVSTDAHQRKMGREEHLSLAELEAGLDRLLRVVAGLAAPPSR